MRIKSKILATVLCLLLCFGAVACNKDGDGGNGDGTVKEPTPIGTVTQPEEFTVERGLHKVSVTPSDNVLVKADGTSEYTVLYPNNASDQIVSVARTLVRNMGLAVDADVEAEAEGEREWNEESKYIVLGNCDMFAAAELTMPSGDDALGKTGVYLKTVGKSVFINGNHWLGVNNGIFVFLEHVFGHDQFYDNTTTFTVKKGQTVTLPNMEIIERPDFEYADHTTNQSRESALANRLTVYESFMNLEGTGDTVWHNSFVWYNDAARNAHPEWVADNKAQLCYTAHGDPEEYEKMLQYGVDYAMRNIEKNPDCDNMTLTQQDIWGWCLCETCTAENEKYGTDSAVVIKFCNDLAKRINEKLHETQPERNITIWFFGYHETAAPPVKTDASGKVVPFDDTVKCRDDVAVIIAPIESKYTHTYFEEINEKVYQNIMAWDAVAKVKGAWLYSTNFNYLYYPYNCFDTIAPDIRLFKSVGTQWIWNQGAGYGMTAFAAYKEYLNAKLYWDVTRDVNELRQRFFDGYYGAASEIMFKMYSEIVAHCNWIEQNFDEINGGLYENVEQAAMWPKGLLERWENYCREALEAVAPMQTEDPVYYDSLVENIVSESMFPRFALIRLYKTSYSKATLNAMRDSWRADATKYNFMTHCEHYSINDVYQEWELER